MRLLTLSNGAPVERAQCNLRFLQPGQSLAYHKGYLVEDRARSPAVAAVADFFQEIGTPEMFRYAEGLVVNGRDLGYLSQRRLEKGGFLYLFTRR